MIVNFHYKYVYLIYRIMAESCFVSFYWFDDNFLCIVFLDFEIQIENLKLLILLWL